MRKLLFIIFVLISCSCYSQNENEIGITAGFITISDAKYFNDITLSKFPNRPFIQMGVGFKIKHVTFTTTYVFDIRQLTFQTYIPLFVKKNGVFKLNK